CPLDHPDVAQLQSTGGIPLDELKTQARTALEFAERKENDSKCKLHPRRIQVASQEVLDKMGINPLVPVWPGPVEESVAGSGDITHAPTRVANLSAPIPGRVWRVEARGQLGQAVKKDEVLALVEAAEVGKAKAEFLQAVAVFDLRGKALERMRPGFKQGAISEARFHEAEAAVREAQIRLVGAQQALGNLGLPIRAEAGRGPP